MLQKGTIITSQHPPLLQQFRSFYFQNNFTNFEEAVERFAIFGGISGVPDHHMPLLPLIKMHILDRYEHYHRQMTSMTLSDSIYHSLLTGIALGDGRVHSAYKRARIASDIGDAALRYLCESGMIRQIHSAIESVEPKLYFNVPFVRFWFAFVSPIFKGIREGDYAEFEVHYLNRKQEFTEWVFKQLCMELIRESFKDDPIVEIGHYWNHDVEIDSIAKTRSGKTIATTCKYTHAKIRKNELSKLQQQCHMAHISVDTFVMVSKRGFSNEVKALKSRNLRLFSIKSFKNLVATEEEKNTIKKHNTL